MSFLNYQQSLQIPINHFDVCWFVGLSWAQNLDDLDLPRQEKPPSLVKNPSQSFDKLIGPTTTSLLRLTGLGIYLQGRVGQSTKIGLHCIRKSQ